MQAKQANFAIITIREDEFKAIASRFKLTPERGASGRNYGISHIQTRDGKNRTVAIARCAEQGPQPAQQLAHEMINDLSPSLLLVVGIAGAVPDTDLTLGDVVVSSRIHDFGVNAFKPGEIQWDIRGGIHPYVSDIISSLPMYETELEGWNTADSIRVTRPSLDITKFRAFDITKMTTEDKQSIFDGTPPESWQQKILDMLKWHFADPPQRSADALYKSGSIASSGSLVRDTAILIQWLQNARSIRAIEMEAGGVFQAAQQLRQQYPVMAIRGISDIIGLRRDYRWTPYACHTAAAFTYALLTSNSQIFENLHTEQVHQQAQQQQATVTHKNSDTQMQSRQPLPELVLSEERQDEFHIKHQQTHRKRINRYVLAGLTVLLIVFLVSLSWWYPVLFQPRTASQPLTKKSNSENNPLEVSFRAIESKLWVIPGNPTQYSLKNLPEKQKLAGALYTDGHLSAPLYHLYLEIRNLSNEQYSDIIIKTIRLKILQVRPLPQRPVPLWMDDEAFQYESPHKYEALYLGTQSGFMSADHVNPDYVTNNFGLVTLSPQETETVELHVISRIEADIIFSIQVMYFFGAESLSRTLTLASTFEVMFFDKSSAILYRFQAGHFIKSA